MNQQLGSVEMQGLTLALSITVFVSPRNTVTYILRPFSICGVSCALVLRSFRPFALWTEDFLVVVTY